MSVVLGLQHVFRHGEHQQLTSEQKLTRLCGRHRKVAKPASGARRLRFVTPSEIPDTNKWTMNLALRIAAAILSVPPDVLAPFVPMMAPPPRNGLEIELRNEVDSALSGSCCRSSSSGGGGDEHHDMAPLFAISREEAQYVDCKSGLPPTSMEERLFNSGGMSEPPSTYGEITSLGTTT